LATRKNTTAVEFATLFLNGIVKYHGLPAIVRTDRDRRVTSDMWQELCRKLGIRHHMTTAYRPQANGQAERVNQNVDQLLRVAQAHGVTWEDALPQIEIALNNAAILNTEFTPYLLTYGYHPTFLGELPDTAQIQVHEETREFVKRIQEMYDQFSRILQDRRNQQLQHENRDRQPTTYQPGDKVMINWDKRSTRAHGHGSKLEPRFVGPYKVIRQVNLDTYLIELPRTSRAHPIFHAEYLKPYHMNVTSTATVTSTSSAASEPASCEDSLVGTA